MKLVQDPTQFDVLLMENLYGDLRQRPVRGLGRRARRRPGANIGDDGGGVRGGARLRAGHRRQGHRQPAGAADERRDDAQPPRRRARRPRMRARPPAASRPPTTRRSKRARRRATSAARSERRTSRRRWWSESEVQHAERAKLAPAIHGFSVGARIPCWSMTSATTCSSATRSNGFERQRFGTDAKNSIGSRRESRRADEHHTRSERGMAEQDLFVHVDAGEAGHQHVAEHDVERRPACQQIERGAAPGVRRSRDDGRRARAAPA